MSSDRAGDRASRLVCNSKITPYDASFLPVYRLSGVTSYAGIRTREARAIRRGQMLVNMQMMGDNPDLWLLK